MCAEWWSHLSDDHLNLRVNSRVLLLLERGNMITEAKPTDWDEHCQKCIRSNGVEPEELLYCPAEDDCEYMKKKLEGQHDKN